MGKLDELLKSQGAAIEASMGVGYSPAIAPPGMSATDAQQVPTRLQGVTKARDAAVIPTDKIQPDPDQPREEFDPEALGRLAESLKTRGQLQPIRVRWDEGRGAYVIIMGERRWRAAVQAGLPTLTCVVHEKPVEPGEQLALQLVENALREDLKPIEQAKAYKRLMDLHGWSGSQLAKELAVAQPTVVQALALLKLPEDVQAKVEDGALAPRTAYEIVKLDAAAEQQALAEQVIAEQLTRDQTAQVVKARKSGRATPAAAAARREIKLGDGTKVTVAGPGAAGPETAQAALKAALKVVQAEAKATAQAATPGRAA